jgi:diguanylate cyclase (GGDEF)-like protein
VDEAHLQDKGNRYYYKNTIDSERDELVLSEIDLNIENGAIELPYRPTLRISKTIYNGDQPYGVLVINFDIKSLLAIISDVSDSNHLEIQVLNADGYWINHWDKEKEWGFMFDAKLENNLSILNKKLWQSMQNGEAGTQTHQEDYVTYGKFEVDDGETLFFVATKAVDSLFEVERRAIMILIIVYLLILVVLLLGSYFGLLFYYARKASKAELERQALYDALTHIPNRLSFNIEIKNMIENKEIEEFALFFMDLDGFKHVNDTFGHDIGDKVLIDVSKRLKHILREQDLIFRLGGDEFTLLCSDLKDKKNVEIIARKIIQTLSHKYVYDDKECQISVSIGISLFPYDGENASELLNIADDHMYEVKKHGKHNYNYNENL